MFEIDNKCFDIALMQSTDIVESFISDVIIDSMSMKSIVENVDDYIIIMESKMDKLKTKVLNAIESIMNALKDFADKIILKVSSTIEKKKINDKLAELKEMLAKKRSAAMNKSVDYMDIKQYLAYYTEFINRYTNELKKGLNKEFKSEEEVLEWQASVQSKLDDFNYKMSDQEQWKISVAVNNAIDLTEKEAANRANNLKMIHKHGMTSINELNKIAKSFDTSAIVVEASFVNYEKEFKTFKVKQMGFMQTVSTQLAKAVRTVINIVSKHPLIVIAMIAALFLG